MPCCSTNRSQRSSAITSIRLETERFSKDAICSSLFRCSSLTARLINPPFEDMEALVVDENLREVGAGCEGELLMSGPQLSHGYWRDDEKTRRTFTSVAGRNGTYYRTGDRVRRSGPNKPLIYLGRFDSQVKVLGHRVELGEVEAVVRSLCGVAGVVALAWPNSNNADGIELFLEAEKFDTELLAKQLKTKLSLTICYREEFGLCLNFH